MTDHNHHRRLTDLLWERRVQHPEVPMRPRPDKLAPPLINHPFEPLALMPGLCSRVEVEEGTGRPCDRPADEHAPASTSSETEV